MCKARCTRCQGGNKHASEYCEGHEKPINFVLSVCNGSKCGGHDGRSLLLVWLLHQKKEQTCSKPLFATRNIEKLLSIRWLRLEQSITRALRQHTSLKSYFLSGQESAASFKRLKDSFGDPMREVCCRHFCNLFLPREEPLVGE